MLALANSIRITKNKCVAKKKKKQIPELTLLAANNVLKYIICFVQIMYSTSYESSNIYSTFSNTDYKKIVSTKSFAFFFFVNVFSVGNNAKCALGAENRIPMTN